MVNWLKLSIVLLCLIQTSFTKERNGKQIQMPKKFAIQERIHWGQEVNVKDFPYIVTISKTAEGVIFAHGCIISLNWVLTAAEKIK